MLQANVIVCEGLYCTAESFASRAADPEFNFCLCWNFSRSSHTSDLKVGTLAASLPGAWHYRVSAGTGWPSVSIQ